MGLSTEISQLKHKAINVLDSFLSALFSSSDARKQKQCALLSYWIVDYVRMLRRENSTVSYRRFKRGDIVKVHLGYRVGHEEGGLHYAVVLNTNDSPKNSVLTVVPLTSLKSAAKINHLGFGDVFIGSELLQQMYDKIQAGGNGLLTKEAAKLKWCSIALTNQVVTVSKIRIYDPVKNSDPLSGIRLASATMEKIDEKLRLMFFDA